MFKSQLFALASLAIRSALGAPIPGGELTMKSLIDTVIGGGKGGPWNVNWAQKNGNAKPSNDGGKDALVITYPKGSYNPGGPRPGGFEFTASPSSIFPADEVTFSYEVKFSENWQWVKGGKLPGLKIGKELATGGRHRADAATFRVVWKAEGRAVAYLYLPTGVEQSAEYKQLGGIETGDESGQFGTGLWKEAFQLRVGQWNSISVYVKLNSFNGDKPAPDGRLALTINGVKKSFDKIIWRGLPNVQIESVLFSTFFGGNSPDRATPEEVTASFANFKVSKGDSVPSGPSADYPVDIPPSNAEDPAPTEPQGPSTDQPATPQDPAPTEPQGPSADQSVTSQDPAPDYPQGPSADTPARLLDSVQTPPGDYPGQTPPPANTDKEEFNCK